MRTSPPAMRLRPRARRAPVPALLALLLAAAPLTACSDDGDADTTPTTTSPTTEPVGDGGDATTSTAPPDEETTTSEATDTGGEPGSAPGDEADVLTADQAHAQLETLLAAYRRGVAEAATTRALDERTLATFSGAFTGSRADVELQALQQAGVDVLNPTPPEVIVGDVEVTSAAAGCAAGTATIEGISGFVTVPVETVQPYYFRLVPAADGAAAPAWRLDFLNFSSNGEPLAEATCE